MNADEQYFDEFRTNTIGHGASIRTVCGTVPLTYCDYTASGRLYRPIEERMTDVIGPYLANTHTTSNLTGTAMTDAYHASREVIKRHVNAGPHDVLLAAGFGMTSAVNRLQRILGLRVPEFLKPELPPDERPVVFITHMEHHSNQITWLETIADVVCLEPGPDGLVSVTALEEALHVYRDRTTRIGAFTACSNVTGVRTPYHALAAAMHRAGGVCFVDFAAGAPYQPIDMHPADPDERLDGIYFSPHKFLGGPGTAGLLLFDSRLYRNRVPESPGGGTVEWTDPWGGRKYIDDIEIREDGGTPGFLQSMRAAMCIRLKEKMGIDRIDRRERRIVDLVFAELEPVAGLHLLAQELSDRIAIVSFYVEDAHYNLFVRLLNDRFGIQVRGGCSCAGTYGHYLLHIDKQISHRITSRISRGDLSSKPGWVRLSFHPMMTDDEVRYVTGAVRETVRRVGEWKESYRYDKRTNEFRHVDDTGLPALDVETLFDV